MNQLSEDQIQAIRHQAESYYREGKFFCSEAVVKSVLDGFRVTYPEQVIGMASGFPVGLGGAKCTCGAVTGGSLVMGYLFGRNQAGDNRVYDAMAKSKQIHDQFTARNKVACCKILTRKFEMGSPEHMEQCIRFTGEVAEDTARLVNQALSDQQ